MRWLPLQCTVHLMVACGAVCTGGSMTNHVSAADAPLPPVASTGQAGYVHGQLIYPLDQTPTPQCHASTIEQTASGLVAAWFGGTREKDPDVGIWVARLEGGAWTQPVEVADGVYEGIEYACWNPVLFQPADGPLLLFYKVGPSPSEWWGMMTTSDDGGRNWTSPRKLGHDAKIGHLLGPVKNKPVQRDDGSILAPSSTEHQGWRVHFERLERGQGGGWEVVEVIGPIDDAQPFNAIQPSILTYANGAMQIICRTQEQVLAQSWSHDHGASWSELTATDLPNPNSGTDAVTLKDGRQLLVYNHTTRGGDFPSGRQMLNVALSDDGRRWQPVLTLEQDEGEFSYPAVIQTDDGQVHVTYTYNRRSIKHVVLDPGEIHSR